MGALAPLVKVANARTRWFRYVGAYTAAGLAASVIVGIGISRIGQLILPSAARPLEIPVAIGLAAAAASREFGWARLPLLQLKRQTRSRWWGFGGTLTAIVWGFDIGLVFTTYMTYAGVWFLVVIAAFVSEPLFGASLFTVYWLGRASVVWVIPLLASAETTTPGILVAINAYRPTLRRIHAFALTSATLVLATHGW